ncbi:hypothetical protein ACSXCN_02780 [Clostridium perfringens]|uniref:hypothetical protein n=1 Tax=Clostridium perfringens TaxID=1502 RepID=UPI0024BBF019|nr:hypothetical protein [Clostridium perfringens]MDK0609908.1 hypothetical protein [Clostridium perfringens]MDM0757234.1 hypothetical protein [Clostridium perfringens]
MKIKIKWFVYLQIFLSVVLNYVTTTLKLPNFLLYIQDLINILLVLFFFKKIIKTICSKEYRSYFFVIGLLIVVLIIGDTINGVNPFLVIWGVRNNFRFLIFWIICICSFNIQDEKRLFNLLNYIQIINFSLVIYQHFVLGLEQDLLGGIFGTQAGSNGRMNIFLCILLCYQTAQYMYKKCSIFSLLWIIVSSMIIAVYSEIKVLYIEIIIILLLTVIISRASKRKILIVVAGALGLLLGLSVLKQFDPYTYSIITNFDNVVEYGNMESGGYNISRFSAFSTINNLFFKNNWIYNLFGFGLGSCDTSSFSIFNSSFYVNYGWLHYLWFSHQIWFLETGYLGLGLILAFFFVFIYKAIKNRKKMLDGGRICVFTCTLVVMIIINLWYNNSIRLENAYLTFACLSFLPIFMKQENK